MDEKNTNLINSIIDQADNSNFTKEGAIHRSIAFQKSKEAIESMQDKINMKKIIEKSYRQHMEKYYGSENDRY